MSTRSRVLIAAAALGALAASPALAAGMANTNDSMMSSHDNMVGGSMSTHQMTKHHAAKMRHKKKSMHKMAPEGTMAPDNSSK
jgi:hypothetical protein